MHIGKAQVAGRGWIGYSAIGCAQVARSVLGVWIGTDEEQVAHTSSIRGHHFHHELESAGRYSGGYRYLKYGVRLIWNVEFSRCGDQIRLPVAAGER